MLGGNPYEMIEIDFWRGIKNTIAFQCRQSKHFENRMLWVFSVRIHS